VTEYLVPWMKAEDPVLWVLLAIVGAYALGGAAWSWAATRRGKGYGP